MKTNPPLVGANGPVELYTVTNIHMHLTIVIGPRYSKRENPIGLHNTLHDSRLLEFWMPVVHLFN